jgi:hypothetical protein
MATLKEKFGKFELDFKRIKVIKGGVDNDTVKCFKRVPDVEGGELRLIGEHKTNSNWYRDEVMQDLYDNIPGFVGCW